jgi:hypothetical protein
MRAKTTSFTFAVCDGLKIQHMHDYSDSHGPRVQQIGYRDVRGVSFGSHVACQV